MLIFSCALACEAKPLIQQYNLKQKASYPFPIYLEDDKCLVITGVGEQRISSALHFAYGYVSAPKNCGFINVGVCAHSEAEIGQGYLVAKVSKENYSSFYPFIAHSSPLPSCSLQTVTEPKAQPKEGLLYDMEGHAFFQASSGISRIELISIIKVVSDNGWEGDSYPNKQFVSSLIKKNISAIGDIVEAIKQRQKTLETPETNIEKIADFFTLTESERIQFTKLLRAYKAIHNRAFVPNDHISTKSALLKYLQSQITTY